MKGKVKMIRHIVMFKLKENSDEIALKVKKEFNNVIENVPTLRKAEFVINSADAPQSNYTVALICDFDDIDGLNQYQVHPVHKKFGAFIQPLREERACIDYEF